MGHWYSLHLFDEKRFHKEGVPILKGQISDLQNICHNFLKDRTGGITHLSLSETTELIDYHINRFTEISKCFDESFSKYTPLDKIGKESDRINHLQNLDLHYEFCDFFEYFIFNTYADFFPHVGLGKAGIQRNFEINRHTLSHEIITYLDSPRGNDFFAFYANGIVNWLNHEEISLLYYDKHNLNYTDNPIAEGFLTLLDFAFRHKLGLILGMNMREKILELLPKNKLISVENAQKLNAEGLISEF